jgi:ABC-type glycerol-3-phosphate transport system substrate-binding protein
MKRKLALLLTVLMFISVFTACAATPGDGTETTAETAAVSGTAGAQITEDVPENNYNGASFRVLVRPGSYIKEFYVESDTGDVVDTAVFNRNQTIEERFNIEFVFNESSDGNYETDAQKAITAGDDAYELVLPHARAATIYGQENLLVNWYELEFVDLEKPWWNRNVVEQFTLYDKLYCMTGSLSYLSLGMSFGTFFNKNIYDDLNIAYPYETVAAGTWTFDKMAETALKSSKDLNGDGVMSMSDDQFGYTTP